MSITIPGALSRLDEAGYRAELYRAWSAAHSAGLPAHVALEQFGASKSAAVEELRRHLIVGLSQDRTFDALVKARPKLFSPLEVAVLLACEKNENTGHAIQLLAAYFSSEHKRMLKVRLRMGYPIFAGVVAAFVATLPVLGRYGWRGYIYAIGFALVALWLLGGIVISILAGIAAAGITPTRARFVQALITAIDSGVPVGTSIRIAANGSHDSALVRHLAKYSERDLNTTPMTVLFAGCASIPALLMSQMAVADATGDYLNTLRKYFDELPQR